MTVKELKNWLNDLPEDKEIYLVIDEFLIENNYYICVAKPSTINSTDTAIFLTGNYEEEEEEG